MKQASHQRAPLVRFVRQGIAARDVKPQTENDWELHTVSSFKGILGHSQVSLYLENSVKLRPSFLMIYSWCVDGVIVSRFHALVALSRPKHGARPRTASWCRLAVLLGFINYR